MAITTWLDGSQQLTNPQGRYSPPTSTSGSASYPTGSNSHYATISSNGVVRVYANDVDRDEDDRHDEA